VRRALDLSRPGDHRVELRLAGAPPSPSQPEETEEAEAPPTCRTWYVDARNHAERPVEVFPWLGNPDADLDALSETERARGAGDLITVLGVGERQAIRLRAAWPILLLFGSRVSGMAPGAQDRPFIGWITPEEQEIRRMQGLRLRISCEEAQE
jgi:hypothetical protein